MALDERLVGEFKKQSLPLLREPQRYDQQTDAIPLELAPVLCRPLPRGVGFPPHRDPCLEMTYVFSGEVTYIVGGRVLLLEAGDLLFVSREAEHGVRPAGSEDLVANFYLREDLLREVRGLVPLTPELDTFLSDVPQEDRRWTPYLYFKTGNHVQLRDLVEVVLCEVLPHFSREHRGSPAPLDAQLARAAMTMVFHIIARDLTAQVAGASTYIEQGDARTIYGYIDKHYRDASLGELARLMNCSESAASRQIRKLTGSTFTELVQERRFERARWFLEDSLLPVSDIAAAVGYENFSYFYRRFRELYGCSPNKYRRLNDGQLPENRRKRGKPADL